MYSGCGVLFLLSQSVLFVMSVHQLLLALEYVYIVLALYK